MTNYSDNLFVADLDKTLLRSDLTLSRFTVTVLNKLVAAGVPFTCATARSPEKALQLLKPLELRLPLIALNGAVIVDGTNHLRHANALDSNSLTLVLAIAAGFGISPFLLGREKNRDIFLYTEASNEGQAAFIAGRSGDRRLRKVDRIVGVEHNLLLNFIADEKILRPLFQRLKASLPADISLALAPDPYISDYYSLEVGHVSANKAAALRQVAGEMDLPLSAVTVFGDHLNDLDMFLVAGEALAMANALEEVKRVATKVIGGNDEDGVARYLHARFHSLFKDTQDR